MIHYPNKEDWDSKFWKNNYRISLGFGSVFMVNADNEQDALDYVIDYCEDNLPGFIMTEKEESEEDYLDDYVSGGNNGKYLNTFNIHIELLK